MIPVFRGTIGNYSRFSAHKSFNQSWHRSYDAWVEKYGRYGYAYDLGLGAELVSQFQITRISMKIHRYAEVIIPWLGMLIATLSLSLWLTDSIAQWRIFTIMGLMFVSVTFYYLAVEALKYDSLGWALVPLGYFALVNENYFLFSLVFLGVTYMSISVAIVQGLVWFAFGFMQNDPVYFFFACLPAGVKVLSHLSFAFHGKGLKSLMGLLNGIGLTKKKKSSTSKTIFRKRVFYFSSLWCLVPLAIYLWGDNGAIDKVNGMILGLIPPALLIFNRGVRRFADDQTVFATAFFAQSFLALYFTQWEILPLFWLAISPAPFIVSFKEKDKDTMLLAVPKREPFNLHKVRPIFDNFLEPVANTERVFFDDNYVDFVRPSFERTRVVREYLHGILNERNSCIVPDIFMTFDNFGGRFSYEEVMPDQSPKGRVDTLRKIHCRYLMRVTNKSGLEPDWLEQGFELVREIDMKKHSDQGFWEDSVFYKKKPFLQLLLLKGADSSWISEGEILEMKPNHLRVKLDSNGVGRPLFMHSDGWTCAEATVAASDGEFPWIAIKGEPNQVVDLNYDFFKNN